MLTLISQRVIKNQYGELDALGEDYTKYFEKFGLDLIPVSNFKKSLSLYLNIPIERIILSGGNDIGESYKRDKTEKGLLNLAIDKKIPVLGICRGMQFINTYFGGGLIKNIKTEIGTNINHVAATHSIKIIDDRVLRFLGDEINVNSYHNQGINSDNLSLLLKKFAWSNDGIIEGIYHPSLPIAGIQWHPERKSFNDQLNEKLIESFLNQTLFWKK